MVVVLPCRAKLLTRVTGLNQSRSHSCFPGLSARATALFRGCYHAYSPPRTRRNPLRVLHLCRNAPSSDDLVYLESPCHRPDTRTPRGDVCTGTPRARSRRTTDPAALSHDDRGCFHRYASSDSLLSGEIGGRGWGIWTTRWHHAGPFR